MYTLRASGSVRPKVYLHMQGGWVDAITSKSDNLCMFSSFCEKLFLKMGNIFREILKTSLYTQAGGWMGLVRNVLMHTPYREGGLVKNLMILLNEISL